MGRTDSEKGTLERCKKDLNLSLFWGENVGAEADQGGRGKETEKGQIENHSMDLVIQQLV